MRLSRRVWFFLAVMIICLAMLAPTPREYWPLNLFMAALALFWAVLLGIEDILGRREPTPPPTWTDPDDVGETPSAQPGS